MPRRLQEVIYSYVEGQQCYQVLGRGPVHTNNEIFAPFYARPAIFFCMTATVLQKHSPKRKLEIKIFLIFFVGSLKGFLHFNKAPFFCYSFFLTTSTDVKQISTWAMVRVLTSASQLFSEPCKQGWFLVHIPATDHFGKRCDRKTKVVQGECEFVSVSETNLPGTRTMAQGNTI